MSVSRTVAISVNAGSFVTAEAAVENELRRNGIDGVIHHTDKAETNMADEFVVITVTSDFVRETYIVVVTQYMR